MAISFKKNKREETKVAKQKGLTLADINKYGNQYDEKKEITLLVKDENTSEIKEHKQLISKRFKRTDIQKMVIDYISFLQEFQQRRDITMDSLQDLTILFNALAVKYFTNIVISKIDNLEKLIELTTKLTNMGVIEQLFESDNGFDKNELKFLGEQIDKSAKQIGDRLGEIMTSGSINEYLHDDEDKREDVDIDGV